MSTPWQEKDDDPASQKFKKVSSWHSMAFIGL
jgi:hypothetical protein